MTHRMRARQWQAVVAILIVCAACRRDSGPARIDAQLNSLIPPDTVVLTGAKLNEIRSSTLYQVHIAGRPASELEDYAKKLGFDLRKDLDEFLSAYDGKSSLFLGRGQFPVATITEQLSKQSVRQESYKGKTIYGGEDLKFVFLTDRVAAVGPDDAALRRAIDQQRQPAVMPVRLKKLADQLPEEAQAWIVSATPLPADLPETGIFPMVQKILGSIESGFAWLNLSRGMRFGIVANCPDAASAKKLHDAMRGILGMGRLTWRDQPELLQLLDRLLPKQVESQVRVEAEWSAKEVNALIDQVSSLRR